MFETMFMQTKSFSKIDFYCVVEVYLNNFINNFDIYLEKKLLSNEIFFYI